MDTNFLYKHGLVLKNIKRMLADRCYASAELDALVCEDELETMGRVYTKAKAKNQSLAETASTCAVHAKKQQSIYVWILDRNYDPLKLKERMTSTDQIKQTLEKINKLSEHEHILVSPIKCSPQAKKELNEKIVFFFFDELLIDLPRHCMSSKHTPISFEETKQYLGNKIKKYDLPRLLKSDPFVRWYNWPEGTIIFINNPIMSKFRIVY